MQQLTILGSTGSIGKSTLDVVSQHRDQYRVRALSAHSNHALMLQQCREFSPVYAVMTDGQAAASLRAAISEEKLDTEVLSGKDALEQIASLDEVDSVMAAIVGAAGLLPTLAAVKAGKRVMLANKEALVMSGRLFTDMVTESGAVLLPIDSEHNAIFQCMPENYSSLQEAGISKILLTGSGGPFRETAIEKLDQVTPDQACAHPNWSMGRKISVDSASMMNKGLEFIEACWLFNAKPDDIDVVVHPQSIVHSMVQYADGSVLAQMGNPDMRTPIAHCLAWPQRMSSGVEALDFAAMKNLSFELPDFSRFPCLRLAIDAAKSGGDYAVALNAANEVAVSAFLDKRIRFTHIGWVVAEVLESWAAVEPDSIPAVIDADERARQLADELVRSIV
ncbi:MAG: 1-deoxy-D-xylulose-5-phosphate reductoisomerase [Agarilytica sp.]